MYSGATVAYIRVSTEEQNEARQIEALKNYNITNYKPFIEKASAKDTNRPELMKMLDYVREGDSIYVLDFSRLARSVKDLLDIVETLTNKGVKLVSLKENLDTSTPSGRLMLTVIGAIYEFERANLLERQKEGILLARKAGKYKGRKEIKHPQEWEGIYSAWKQRKLTGKQAMEQMNLKPNTFYKLVKKWEFRS